MKEPNHKVKHHFVPFSDKEKPHWYQNRVRGWLGSSLKDKNNHVIFEGDRVKFGELGNTGTVAFRNAMFVIDHDHADKFTVLGNTVGFVDVEVIGHIAEEQQ